MKQTRYIDDRSKWIWRTESHYSEYRYWRNQLWASFNQMKEFTTTKGD